MIGPHVHMGPIKMRLAWITWIPFILWFSMIFKIGLNIVHGFMNATFIYDGYEQWSSMNNVHSYIYEHTSCMINDHRNSYDHWSSMIIDHNWHSNRSMIVAMECCWSYMISVDQWVISWSLLSRALVLLVPRYWWNTSLLESSGYFSTELKVPPPEVGIMI